ncbi:CHAD domain-containing protein [Streptomyces sp. NPDC093225]|uniref:CYTH and CHAD domain-containing protein n=1 Tax=Streptomyces sp. NPDC093225 TaxID=3366034 RepID=UPI00380593AF
MADAKREIERKFEFDTSPEAGKNGRKAPKKNTRRLPDLSGTAPVAASEPQGTVELDAVYYDTPDQRLAADGLTLRRRTGGADAGWHLKLPVAPGVRDEITAPLSDAVPRPLAALVRSRVRGADLVPLVRLLSSRDVVHLKDADGHLLAELSTDTVRAERLADPPAAADWTEVEAELADGVDPDLLDTIEQKFRKAGLRVSDAPSKLARALAETGSARPPQPAPPLDSAGAYVLAYVREQVAALVAHDPAVRRDLPDSVHQMRVATRRLRSAFKTHKRVLDRTVTDPIGEELRWLAAELGVDRDQEVLMDRLQDHLGELPRTLQLGPVRGRLRIWNTARRAGSRRRALAVLDGPRYLALLDALDALLADPPLLPGAAKDPAKAFGKAVRRDHDRLARRVGHALSLDAGPDRDLALHEARKAAKRTRYAAEGAVPVLGPPAKRFAKQVKAVQSLLGDHQDSVVAREALRLLAVQAHAAGESAFTWGLLYGREEAVAERRERELPQTWAEVERPAW